MFEFGNNKKQEKEILKQLSESSQKYKKVFEGEDGKWVLEDLAKRCFENTTTFDPDIKKICFNEGRRSVYKYIKSMVEKNIQEMQEELTK